MLHVLKGSPVQRADHAQRTAIRRCTVCLLRARQRRARSKQAPQLITTFRGYTKSPLHVPPHHHIGEF